MIMMRLVSELDERLHNFFSLIFPQVQIEESSFAVVSYAGHSKKGYGKYRTPFFNVILALGLVFILKFYENIFSLFLIFNI